MNIFYLDKDTETCAKYHCDKHVVKMVLEYAQLMSTAHQVMDKNPQDGLYKKTHTNHPSAIWVRKSADNYKWLFSLWEMVLKEYTYRYGKHHASERLYDLLKALPQGLGNKGFTQPPPTMDAEYIISDDSIKNYRNYYNLGKAKLLHYKNREFPYWVQLP